MWIIFGCPAENHRLFPPDTAGKGENFPQILPHRGKLFLLQRSASLFCNEERHGPLLGHFKGMSLLREGENRNPPSLERLQGELP